MIVTAVSTAELCWSRDWWVRWRAAKTCRLLQ